MLGGLTAGAALPLLSGCDVLGSSPEGRAPTGVGASTASAQAQAQAQAEDVPAFGPDVRLAAEALAVTLAAADALAAWLETTPPPTRRVAARVAAAEATHRTHAALLESAVPAASPRASGRLAPDLAGRASTEPPLSAVRVEAMLGSALRDASLEAASGPFARLLAAMAAASSQHAALLRGTVVV